MQEPHVCARNHRSERVVGKVGVARAVIVRWMRAREHRRKQPGQVYCERLLPFLERTDVREHLDHLTRALVDLQPRRGSGKQQSRCVATQPGARP